MSGDAAVIMMADESDDCRDVVYLFICLYIWLEKYFSRGDYKKKTAEPVCDSAPANLNCPEDNP
jgi:hypothetical protein